MRGAAKLRYNVQCTHVTRSYFWSPSAASSTTHTTSTTWSPATMQGLYVWWDTIYVCRTALYQVRVYLSPYPGYECIVHCRVIVNVCGRLPSTNWRQPSLPLAVTVAHGALYYPVSHVFSQLAQQCCGRSSAVPRFPQVRECCYLEKH